MAKSKSIIPEQAQVPAAIILAVFFALILWWRFGPKEEPADSEEGSAATQIESAAADLDGLKALLASAEEEPWSLVGQRETLPPLARNPFLSAFEARSRHAALEIMPDDEAEDDELEEEPAGSSREEILASLVLTGTCVMGSQAMALMNDRYLKVGDEIAGFVVAEVEERKVVLKDDAGSESLYIASPLWLPAGNEP